MPSPATILLIATLLPLASFVLLLFVGKRMGTPKLRMGTSLAGWVATAAIGGSFLCSLLAMYQWYVANQVTDKTWGWNKSAIVESVRWIPIGDQGKYATPPADHAGWLDVGIYIDSLTIAMFLMVTTVAVLVHVYSIGYMRGDSRFPRFFTYLSLFCFSMLGLLLSSTLLQIFIFWELVGLCSYLLIGFWFERKAAARAAMKAFIVNRVGDFAFLVGFGLLFYWAGNASLPHLWANMGTAGQGGDVRMLSGTLVPAAAMTVIGICLFFGAVGKSAQFPLHTWLPDAMEGPSPVSALIHAATMVAAGVYLVARLFPLLTPDAKLFIAVIGCITLAMGALIALVQTDIKRVLAYSTISQLGYMMLAIGVGSWIGGLFHLITHAFFKALLFLGAGSVIHAAHHEQDIRKYGGLINRIPATAATFAVAVLAISGLGIHTTSFTYGLSGYYSKTNILTDAGAFSWLAADAGFASAYWLLFFVPVAVAYLTPFYMTRLWLLTFIGKPRDPKLHDHAHETPMMYVPLFALAALSIIAGSELNVGTLLSGSLIESRAHVVRLLNSPGVPSTATRPAATFDPWAAAWRPMPGRTTSTELADTAGVEVLATSQPTNAEMTAAERAREQGLELEHRYVAWAWLIGIAAAIVIYGRGFGLAASIARVAPFSWIHAWLLRKMYFDELYAVLFVTPLATLAKIAGWFDRHVIDGIISLIAASTERLSRVVGWHDRRIVDGAVTGVGNVAWQLGAAARAPQTGRIRFYVTGLMLVVVIGLAVTVGYMIWR